MQACKHRLWPRTVLCPPAPDLPAEFADLADLFSGGEAWHIALLVGERGTPLCLDLQLGHVSGGSVGLGQTDTVVAGRGVRGGP